MKLQKVLSVIFAAAVMSVSLVFAPLSASAQELPPYNEIYVKNRIEFTGISKEELFDYITNMENDETWWEGVESTQLVEGSLDGKFAGRKYLQTGSFAGFPYVTVINITGGQEDVFMSLEGQSPFLSYTSRYDFHVTSNDTVVVTSSSFVEGYGLTPELMNMTIEAAFNNLGNQLGVETSYRSIAANYIKGTGK